jgi:peptide/nickel transport system permease protein
VRAYVARRALLGGATVWLISVAVFVLLRISPGDPVLSVQGANATPEQLESLRREVGLDRPIHRQYVDWLGRVVRGDLGTSIITRVDVTKEFRQRLPVSFQLMAMTMVWVVTAGVIFGIVSARFRNSLLDYGVRLFAILGLSVPGFWVATLVLLVPAQLWGYAPPLGNEIGLFEDPWDNMRQFLPASLVLALGPTASIMRLTRSALLEVLRQDYIRTARAKGLAEKAVVFRHGLRNSLIPVVTLLGLMVANLLGGAVIIEQIFNLQGLGSYVFTALRAKDFPVAQTLVLYTATCVVVMTLVVDLAYAFMDPRIRYS